MGGDEVAACRRSSNYTEGLMFGAEVYVVIACCFY